MENAAKALIIAGSVLLAILVLTLGVTLRSSLQNAADGYVETQDTKEIIKYNSNFEIYAIKDKTITPQDVVTIVEFAKKSQQGTKVYVKGKTGDYIDKTTDSNFNSNRFLEEYMLYEDSNKIYNSFKYKENSIKYNSEGKVSEISFYYIKSKTK